MLILIAIPGLALALYYIYVLTRRTDVGLVSVIAANLYFLTSGDPAVIVGGLHIGVSDLIHICLLSAGVVRTARRVRSLTVPRILALGYLSLFAFSLLRGFGANGFATASNEARGFLGPLLTFLYFLDADVDDRSIRRYVKVYIGFSGALCIIAVLAAAGLRVGSAAISYSSLQGIDPRLLPAQSAAAIAVGGFLALVVHQYRARGLLTQLLSILFLAFAIYMRHRTVWMMLLAGTISLVFFDIRLFRSLAPGALLAAFAVGGLVLYSTTNRGAVGEDQFVDSASNQQTLIWRVNSWMELLNGEDQGPAEMLVGKSMGSGYWRIDPETHFPTTAPPHSEYVQGYTRVGVLGTLCIFGILSFPIVGIYRLRKNLHLGVYPSESIWALILIMELVYGITYSLEVHQYALVGIANAIVIRYRAEARECSDADSNSWDAEAAPAIVAS